MTAFVTKLQIYLTFYEEFSNGKKRQIAYQTEQLLSKKFFDSMFSLESDKMTALWPNDRIMFTFYVTFSNGIPHWTTFVKYFFDLMLKLESDKMTAVYVTFSHPPPGSK